MRITVSEWAGYDVLLMFVLRLVGVAAAAVVMMMMFIIFIILIY
jgi:hypothetical protein